MRLRGRQRFSCIFVRKLHCFLNDQWVVKHCFKRHFLFNIEPTKVQTCQCQRFCCPSRWSSHILDKQLTEDVLTRPLFALSSKAGFQLDLISWRTDSVQLIKGFQGLRGLCSGWPFGLFFWLVFIYFLLSFFNFCLLFLWFLLFCIYSFSFYLLSLLLTFHSSLHICSGSGLSAADVVDFRWLYIQMTGEYFLQFCKPVAIWRLTSVTL